MKKLSKWDHVCPINKKLQLELLTEFDARYAKFSPENIRDAAGFVADWLNYDFPGSDKFSIENIEVLERTFNNTEYSEAEEFRFCRMLSAILGETIVQLAEGKWFFTDIGMREILVSFPGFPGIYANPLWEAAQFVVDGDRMYPPSVYLSVLLDFYYKGFTVGKTWINSGFFTATDFTILDETTQRILLPCFEKYEPVAKLNTPTGPVLLVKHDNFFIEIEKRMPFELDKYHIYDHTNITALERFCI